MICKINVGFVGGGKPKVTAAESSHGKAGVRMWENRAVPVRERQGTFKSARGNYFKANTRKQEERRGENWSSLACFVRRLIKREQSCKCERKEHTIFAQKTSQLVSLHIPGGTRLQRTISLSAAPTPTCSRSWQQQKGQSLACGIHLEGLDSKVKRLKRF